MGLNPIIPSHLYKEAICMNKMELYTDMIKCGFVKMPNTSKWVKQENGFALPNTHAQYINHDSKYQYSSIRKLK